jgi:hypothetical protein
MAVVSEARDAVDKVELDMLKESEEMARVHAKRREDTRAFWEARLRGADFELQQVRGPKSK